MKKLPNAPAHLASMITGRPQHLEGFDYIGTHRYFLTFCTDQRHHACGNQRGDIVTGAATVIKAMGAGKSAARDVDRWLRDGSVWKS